MAVHHQSEGAKAAREVLSAYWADRDMPVDPFTIANEMGIRTYVSALPVNISGLIARGGNLDAQIHVNADNVVTRQRFTCAHELGHYVRGQGNAEIANVDYRDSRNKTPDEWYADGFAAALLMPDADVRQHVEEGSSPVELSKRYQVSLDAMSVRLKVLGLG